MIYPFKHPYSYSTNIVEGWNSNVIGVYYCGYTGNDGKFYILYIGKGTGSGGMRERLLCHLREDYWPDATHFGYHACDNVKEAEDYEMAEINLYKPRYNKIGK